MKKTKELKLKTTIYLIHDKDVGLAATPHGSSPAEIKKVIDEINVPGLERLFQRRLRPRSEWMIKPKGWPTIKEEGE